MGNPKNGIMAKNQFNGLSDGFLKTILVIVIVLAWAIAVAVGLFFPDRQVDSTITTMMGAVVGYFLVDKYISRNKKNE